MGVTGKFLDERWHGWIENGWLNPLLKISKPGRREFRNMVNLLSLIVLQALQNGFSEKSVPNKKWMQNA